MGLLKTAALAALAIGLMLNGALAAAPASTPVQTAAPDPAANPILANMVKLGARLYYLGSRGGLDGWFIVKDGRVQVAYSTADKQNVIIGAMFGPGGDSITAVQVKALFDTNKEVSALLTDAAKQQEDIAKAGSPAMAAAEAQAAANAVKTGALPSVALSPGERLMRDLTGATGVLIGNKAAPQIIMVMDPNCPHCQATWRALRDAVFKNALQIRMVPIGGEGTDNERAAAVFLHVADPLDAWDKYVAGDKNQLAGMPDPGLVTAVRANHELIDSWHINATPYLVYRAKDGTVKVLQGEPDKVSAVLGDLGPS